MNKFFLPVLLLPFTLMSFGQIGHVTGDESKLHAQTKQVNQFFRRFNGEEDVNGKRLYETNADFRSYKLRKNYLTMLFDESSPLMSKDIKEVFILEVTNKKNPLFLDFHANHWFAEVGSVFTYKGITCPIILYFKIEEERLGYKWVISNIYCPQFERYFSHVGDSISGENFIHPMSHELDFMNLYKVFRDPSKIGYYLEQDYYPDHLAIFLKELQEGNLKFVSSDQVKFHFFQIPNWYFEISYFNRNQYNSGWLISNMMRVNDQEKKEIIRNYTHEN